MSTVAVRRTAAVLTAMLLATAAWYAVAARRAEAVVRPSQPAGSTSEDDRRKPEVASGVKFVRNADGSVTRVR